MDGEWLLQGLSEGFRIGLEGNDPKSAVNNCLSALEKPDIIDNNLSEELSYGSIAGPFLKPLFKDFVFNCFGVIPKSEPGNWRLITDLSFLRKGSVNGGISDKNASVSYVWILDAILKLLNLGRGAVMAKFDIKRAYRLLPIHHEDRRFFGMKWNNNFFVDLALPFGLRSAPQIFSRFADVLQHMLSNKASVPYIQHLDDFLIFGKPNSRDCCIGLTDCIEACKLLGVPLVDNKTEGPSTKLTGFGFV